MEEAGQPRGRSRGFLSPGLGSKPAFMGRVTLSKF